MCVFHNLKSKSCERKEINNAFPPCQSQPLHKKRDVEDWQVYSTSNFVVKFALRYFSSFMLASSEAKASIKGGNGKTGILNIVRTLKTLDFVIFD